jgi:integrase
MAKMTVAQIDALKPKSTPYKTAVDTGLMIRVATNGVKTWIVTYVVDGVQHDYRLPKTFEKQSGGGFLSLADAKDEASRIRALARSGVDYKKKLEQERQDELARLAQKAREIKEAAEAQELLAIRIKEENLTVQDLFDVWIADGVSRKDGNATLKRTFKADVLPQIGKIAVKDLTEHHVRELLRILVKRGVNRSAVIMRNNLTQMFAWAEKRQPWRKLMIDGNPIDLIEIEKIVDRDYDLKNERTRKLSPEEIKELKDIFIREQLAFESAPDRRSARHPVETSFQCAIWIMLSTLCRVGEMSMARWENVDFEARTWFIPKADTKGEENDLTIFLSDFSLDQFHKLHATTGHSDWLFPARNHDGHVCVKSMSKRVGDRQSMFKKDADGLARKPMSCRRHDNTFLLGEGKEGAWTPHDLRRTGATMMQSLGVSLDIIDRCQNHVLSGSKVRRAYLQHDYAEEKRNAWQLLGERLTLIINPISNILILNRQA